MVSIQHQAEAGKSTEPPPTWPAEALSQLDGYGGTATAIGYKSLASLGSRGLVSASRRTRVAALEETGGGPQDDRKDLRCQSIETELVERRASVRPNRAHSYGNHKPSDFCMMPHN
jgi:hypothetical protein